MADKVTRIRDHGLNPALELLGVAMLNFPPRGVDTREVRAELVAALGEDLVFTSAVRENTNAAAPARELGMLQYEYEMAAANQEPWYEHVPRRPPLVRTAAVRKPVTGAGYGHW